MNFKFQLLQELKQNLKFKGFAKHEKRKVLERI